MTTRVRGVGSAGAVVLALLMSTPGTGAGQQPVTVEDYARAESRLGSTMSPLLYRARVSPNWLEGDRFWYSNRTAQGTEFVLVDPEEGTRERAFDHEGVAGSLAAVTGQSYSALELPFDSFDYVEGGDAIAFQAQQAGYVCQVDGSSCRRDAAASSGRQGGAAGGRGGRGGGGGGGAFAQVVSPDGNRAAFIRDHNLWVQDVASGAETQLTTDGIEDFGYATNNAGWTKSDRPVLVWSPDSRRIATFQHDARGVGEMYLVSTDVGHPTLEAWKYPLPEDSVIFRISRVVIDVEDRSVVRLDMPPDQHRSTACDHVYCGGTWADVEWSADGSQLAFVSTSRDHKDEYFRIADPVTGAVRHVMEEHVETFFESGYSGVNWRFMPESNELLWFSQRDDWGHLYLYDLTTGEVKSQVTSGEWNVLGIERFDRDERRLVVEGAGREPGDPYFRYFYRVDLDGSVELLTPDSASHSITLSPSGEYFVDSYSTPTTPPLTVVRDMHGDLVVELEEADITDLVAAGWQAPTPFSVKARDGVTDLYGLMYRPSNFDPNRSYPVVNYLYPGPQSGSVGSRSFSPARSDKQAIAELGFIVVEVDAMGTPMRSKSFHETYYGNMGDNGLPDQMTMIEQLAEQNEWMDLDRVGIWGHSGGGFAAADAIMRYPDFYHVAVSQAGNHDNRNYEDDWGEKWQGLLEEHPDGTTNYDNQANQLLADNLRGKLLIAHGTMDSNVPPSNTMLVVDALIEANKDFDLILFPNRRHGFGNEPYMMRRRWDYFVQHLLGVEPPAYEIGRRPIS